MNQLDFGNRTAVVTGGAAGIGFAIAQRLVGSGARVALWDLDAGALAKAKAALGGGTVVHVLNVADADAVARAATATEEALGRIDVLVCSAGIAGPNHTTWEYPPDAWRQVIDVNLNGVFYCNRAVVPVMRKNDYGRIVNIASIAGKEGNPTLGPYSASKAAVICFSKSLAKELVGQGDITVNSISPAVIATPILEGMPQSTVDYMVSKIPMGRVGKPEEVAALAHFLASAEASFTTGQCYDISGGRATY